MTVGFIMLAHTELGRAGDVAQYLSAAGAPLVVHLDIRSEPDQTKRFRSRLAGLPDVEIMQDHACDWGSWAIVQATCRAAERLLQGRADVSHVYLMSGSCLPLWSIETLNSHLAQHTDTDFIESVTTDEVDWTVGGLAIERFILRFPFSWKRQRRLFDRYVDVQRRIGLQRRIPAKLVPHLGSQWWCLTRQTLSSILSDPDRPEYDRYFAKVWIPDESYFQTLSRLHARRIESRSLTLSRFDFQGKPHVFYDDHLKLLRDSDAFFARKIWPRAERIYDEFLNKSARRTRDSATDSASVEKLFSRANDRRTRGRAGLWMAGRFPNEGWENGKTTAPYFVFQGFAELFDGFRAWLTRQTGITVHGNLFAEDRAEFADGAKTSPGCMSDAAKLRDYNPTAFLTNLSWNARGEPQGFQFSPADRQEIANFLVADRNAHLFVISGAWAIPLFLSGRGFGQIRKRAAYMQSVEAAFLEKLRHSQTKARVSLWNLSQFLEDPMVNLQHVLDEIGGLRRSRVTEAPRLRDMTGFGKFLQGLRNEGMSPYLMGDFAVDPADQGASDTPPALKIEK